MFRAPDGYGRKDALSSRNVGLRASAFFYATPDTDTAASELDG